MKDREAFSAQDGIDNSKWQAFFHEHVAFVSNFILGQMLQDINTEIMSRTHKAIGEDNE